MGAQYEFKDYTYFGVKAKDIRTGLEIVHGSGDITLSGDEKRYQTAVLSYFGRFNYDYDGRYLFELNGRYDGSSKFRPVNRWAAFYGASVGWRLKQEAFLRDVDWLSELKLRASYAEVGNQSGISDYDGIQFYNLVSAVTMVLISDRRRSRTLKQMAVWLLPIVIGSVSRIIMWL